MLSFVIMQSNPLYSIMFFAVSLYIFKMWYDDAVYFNKNSLERKGAFAGAYFSTKKMLSIAIFGALALLGIQTLGEYSLDMTKEQSMVSYFAIFTWLGSAFIEELVFRGYLVITNKGKAVLWASIIGFSLIFALMHPFIWDFSSGEDTFDFSKYSFSLNITGKAFFSTFFIFANSVFFYWARFNKNNPKASLLPAIAAHFAYNLGVYAVKLAQGFVE